VAKAWLAVYKILKVGNIFASRHFWKEIFFSLVIEGFFGFFKIKRFFLS